MVEGVFLAGGYDESVSGRHRIESYTIGLIDVSFFCFVSVAHRKLQE